MLISDISDVLVDTGLFFACLTVIDSSNYRYPIEIKVPYLTKADAFLARKILQGLISIKRKHISLASIPVSQVLGEIGSVGDTRIKGIG